MPVIRPWVVLAATAALAVLAAMTFLDADDAPATGNDPYVPWNGRWRGEFVCYDIEGRVRYRLQVEQHYEPAGEGQQRAVFTNRSADGSVETVHAANLIRNGKLICRVRKVSPGGKAIGEMVEHHGRLVGPGHIIWHRKIAPGGFETFNEIIDGDTYWIHGVRVKDGNPRSADLYEGRYVRIER